MSDGNHATLVYSPEDIAWQQTNLGRNFWVSDQLIGADYSALFSARLTKFGFGGGSTPHSHTYNHAFYFLSGTARVQIGSQAWHLKPGSFVKVPAYSEHSVTNTGTEDLIYLAIYDPPQATID